ncbi:unnamed protein product [Durusdinium trenchii]|uniref:Uncharacterized protein n=2 Tax=Durusdinium trenchii TaxID=1381693 RepID=A0ABP0NA38_9DINO
MDLRRGQKGMSVQAIAEVWNVDAVEIEKTLELAQSSAGKDRRFEEVNRTVKRLMEDPPDLCCPISHGLMEDPVVAADGFYYDRSCIMDWLERNTDARSPTTGVTMHVLYPSQRVKSAIIAYKENTVQEILSVRNTSQLQELLVDMDEKEVLWLLRQLDEGMIKSLTVTGPHKILVCKELARRIASSTVADEQGKSLNYLWDILHEHQATDAQESWVKAASLVLAAFSRMLTVQLERPDVKLLRHACGFLSTQEVAATYAKNFFDSDLGISSFEKWPPKSSASIFAALASLVDDDKDEEKLELLMKAHELNDSDAEVRFALSKQLGRCMLRQRMTDDGKHLEGLLLKLHLEKEEDIPAEVLSKLSLEQESLKSLRGSQLMLLAKMLEKANRRADGARVAVAAAEAFAADGSEDESHGAIATAHYLDRTNDDASYQLCALLGSLASKCKNLGNQYAELSDKYNELQKAQQAPIQPSLKSFVWDLSSYDFTNFTEEQEQLSEKFQLGASGVEAWLDLRPKATPDKAGLFFWVSEPVWVKWRFQVGSWEDTIEWEFAKKEDGSISGYGWPKAIPISNLASGIAFHLPSVRRAGSSLRLVAPGS